MAATRSSNVAFVIVVSGPGHNGLTQSAYLIRENLKLQGYSAGESAAVASIVERSWTMQMAGAPYDDFVNFIKTLLDVPFLAHRLAEGYLTTLTSWLRQRGFARESRKVQR